MTQIGCVPEINTIKSHMENLVNEGVLTGWELPYENVLTRLSAAVFYISLHRDRNQEDAWAEMRKYPGFRFHPNQDKHLSQMDWRVEFNSKSS